MLLPLVFEVKYAFGAWFRITTGQYTNMFRDPHILIM